MCQHHHHLVVVVVPNVSLCNPSLLDECTTIAHDLLHRKQPLRYV
jgi:hypothetical protein